MMANGRKDHTALAAEVIESASRRGIMLTMAESCTGGMVATALTNVSGASAVFDRGFVTYSNDAKSDLLGVAATTLVSHGAVSPQTAAEMASGALAAAPRCRVAVAITGIAGPGGGSADKPVGLVWFGMAVRDDAPITRQHHFKGDRDAVRAAATDAALALFLEGIKTCR